MKKLRIAMSFSSDPTGAGGVQEHVYFLSQALRKRGHTVHLYGPRGRRALAYEQYHPVSRVVQVPTPNGNWANITMPDTPLEKVYKEFSRADIVHIHEPYVPFFSWMVSASRLIDAPKVATFHTAWNEDSNIRFLDTILPMFKRPFSASIDGAIYISDIVRKRWHVLSNKSVRERTILYGVDAAFVPIARKNKQKTVTILFVARLVPRKGPMHLLAAFRRLVAEFPHLRLIIVGDGAQREELETFVQDHNLSHFVRFEGEVFGKKKIIYFQKADIFCAPYADEGFGLTLLEAMACGCPIVGFRNEAFEETLRHYPAKNLLVPRRSVEGLEAAFRKLLVNPHLLETLSSWCVRESKQYTWEKVAQETEALYLDILENRHRPKKAVRSVDRVFAYKSLPRISGW